MIELDQHRQPWQRLELKLDLALAMQTELMRQVVCSTARQKVRRTMIWPALDLLFGLAVVLLAGGFLSTDGQTLRTVLPAAVVLVGGIALAVDSIRQLQLMTELDWAGPVAGLQVALERLRLARLKRFKWVILTAPLVGFCGLLVGIHAWGDRRPDDPIPLYDRLNSNWILANVVFGVAFVPVGHAVAGWLAARCQERSWWKAVLDDIAGVSLGQAAHDLNRWAALTTAESSPAAENVS